MPITTKQPKKLDTNTLNREILKALNEPQVEGLLQSQARQFAKLT